MFNVNSRFATFGWWVAWIYFLSLTGLVFLPPIQPPPELPSIVFVERGITVTDEDGTVVSSTTATIRLSKPADAPLNVIVDYIDETAAHGRDFETVLPAARTVHFDVGEQEKPISFGRRGRDVVIMGPTRPAGKGTSRAIESRSFKARLKDNPALQAVGDTGQLAVTILRREWIEPEQPRATFARQAFEEEEKKLIGAPIAVRFDRPLPEKATVFFDLYRRNIDGTVSEEKIDTAERTAEPGEQGMNVQLDSLFSDRALATHRVVDDAFPEADEFYELRLRSSDLYPEHPLALTARNDDGELKVQTASRDGGRAIDLVDNGPDWPEAGDRWVHLTGNTPNGESIDFGVRRIGDRVPLPDDFYSKCEGRRIAYEVAHCDRPAGKGCCQQKGCKGCCPGGGCPKGQCGGGKCGAGKALCGPTVPGDYMLIVVNNERLHEPGDTITERVRKALADESAKPYGNGAIIVNPEDEDAMTANGGGPRKEKMFQPFERDGEDVAAQQRRIEEVIARKREAAERPDLRAVVVWPERDLMSGAGLTPVAGADQQPVSFLFPGADPSYARNMRPLVPAKAAPGSVTIRSPKEDELPGHLINVMRQSREAAPASPSPKAGENAEPGDVDAALRRSTG